MRDVHYYGGSITTLTGTGHRPEHSYSSTGMLHQRKVNMWHVVLPAKPSWRLERSRTTSDYILYYSRGEGVPGTSKKSTILPPHGPLGSDLRTRKKRLARGNAAVQWKGSRVKGSHTSEGKYNTLTFHGTKDNRFENEVGHNTEESPRFH